MQFLLIHSPLVTDAIWFALVKCLENAGFQARVVTLNNRTSATGRLYEQHISQLEAALESHANKNTVAVVHSGAGNLLALLNPDRFAGHVFLDAIFPVVKASRFELFDDPIAVKRWREVAREHHGLLPRSMLERFGTQIKNDDMRNVLVANLADAPIELYEEQIPVHPNWPHSRCGLYVQWTDGYSRDAQRAQQAGFEVRRDTASHFKMLERPDELARELAHFVRESWP